MAANLKLYQMYDLVAMQVTGPIIASTRDEAVVRQFADVLSRPETLPGQYPQDFALLHIGDQNQDTGEIIPVDPVTIYTGKVWLRIKAASSSPANDKGAGEQPATFIGTANDGGASPLGKRPFPQTPEPRTTPSV